MLLHEPATNAAKHGALSVPGGRVEITWARDPAARALRLDWRERDGPAVTVRRLGGSVDFAWEPDGPRCTLRVPLGRLGVGGPDTDGTAPLGSVPEIA